MKIGTFKLTIEGKEIKFRFGMTALREYTKKYGFEAMEKDPISMMTSFPYYACKSIDRNEMSEEDFIEWLEDNVTESKFQGLLKAAIESVTDLGKLITPNGQAKRIPA